MVGWLNSWASGVVVSVIIATLIEMILPENKNKKYIKTIIGIFVLFSIMAPAISAISGNEIDLGAIIQNSIFDEYEEATVQEMDTDATILNTYESKLEAEIISGVQNKGYEVNTINLVIDDTDEHFGNINKIILSVSKKENVKSVEKIEEVEIDLKQKIEKQEQMPQEEITQLQKYLADTYSLEKEQIIIN